MTQKREEPLALDMPFGEPLERFIQIDPTELPDNVKLRQKEGPPKRPPTPKGVDDEPPRPKGKT
jgi:hypothetical protein